MRRSNCRIIACLACICILVGCSIQGESNPSESMDLSSSMPTNAEVTREMDIPIDVDSVSFGELLFDSNQSYILVEADTESGRIYKLCIEKDALGTNTWHAYIEYYETEKMPEGFWNGEKVCVRSAYKNIVNISDYQIFSIRFNMLRTIPLSELKTEAHAQWHRYLVCSDAENAIDLSDAQCGENASDIQSDDNGLVEFMYLLFLDRGIGKHGKQHF